ncbi:MAG: 4-hydroxythreonine-4-phosphate dehydrogenase PdxA [Nitrospirae bacterium]|nr:4-hydroxythreonine-4-phosphate dehydrogenase PdxA [Nitrospirota bacterium]MBF0541842.1 4-hydroxythreonine-4-phosphate dehydrogenase PdxA [Nitrospirota bacterium]
MNKIILITIGDPAGIGPEVALKACQKINHSLNAILIGDSIVLKEAVKLVNPDIILRKILNPSEALFTEGTINYIDLNIVKDSFVRCTADALNGLASAQYIKKAVEILLQKQAHAMVTAPITKDALRLANIPFPGHTEMLADLTDTKDYAMMLIGGGLRVMLVTIHRSIKDVPSLITTDKVYQTIKMANLSAQMLRLKSRRIAVCGLNPHAGENGMFGREEIDYIKPAILKAVSEGIDVTGPYPPDTIFYKAYHKETDIIVAMYHDQGLIPLKMIAFDKGVNVTIGLPIIRTSPDHGTAYDRAWRCIAKPDSMIEAIKLANKLKLPLGNGFKGK